MLNEILVKYPALTQFLKGAKFVKNLGGLTNRNSLFETQFGQLVLRIPGEGTKDYIRRDWEKVAALLTSEMGINAPVLYFDSVAGVQLTKFLDTATTMDAKRFKDLSTITRGARSLRKLHDSGQKFSNQFELFEQIENYLSVLKGATLPKGFFEVRQEAMTVKKALARHSIPLAPCHCDPLAENFLDTAEQMFIIDWEYAGNNDPMWDLGDLSVEAEFDEIQDNALFEAYFPNKSGRPFDRGRMILYKAMCDLLWTLWGVIQHENKNSSMDFWKYAQTRFDRCQKLMKSAEYDRSLTAVMDGG